MHDCRQLFAYIIPETKGDDIMNEMASHRVAEWEEVFSDTYKNHTGVTEVDFNITGWNSSYTGMPFSKEEMKEWVDGTVQRILKLHPKRVLEIGCGTGLLLSRIAPFCEKYIGTDLSAEAIEYVRRNIILKKPDLFKVALYVNKASDFAEIIDDEIDTIILNSIVQYFPDVHYFAKVIEAAVRALGDHGAIFVGDIRNLTFLEAFHTDLQVEKSPASFSTEQLRFNIKKGIALEQELVIDPMLFHFLKEQVPQIKSIQILLRKGVHLNEMTRFRYDAILYVGKERSQAAKAVLDWHHDKLNLSLIRKILAEEKPAAILITRIPNARLRRALKMSALLRRTDCPTTVGGILQMLNNADEIPSVKPEEVWSLGEALEYEVNIYWDEASADGSYTAAFRQSSLKAGFCFDEEDCSIRSNLGSKSRIEDFANSPLLGRFTRQFSPQLRSFCASKLPVYMIPSSFTALNRFPIDTNGKLERRLLPEPIVGQFISDSHIVGPKTEIEKDLTEIWAQVLGIDNIDVRKTFFELGGDSIYSIHVISQAKKRGINLTAQQIFQHQSILELAAEIESKARKYDEKTSESIPRVRYSARDQQVIGQLLLSGNIEDVYPLSPFQNYVLRRSIEDQEPGLFLVHRFNIIKKTDEMGKKLDPAQFDDVFEELIQRYPLLRTSFEWEHMDQPVQLVHKTSKVSIHKRDWRKCSAEEQDRLLRVYLQEDRAVGIDLRNPNSLRLLVCHLEDSYLIVTSYSYMCFDGWSVDLLWQDFFKMLSMSNSPIEVGNLSKMNYKEYVLKMQGQKFGKATEFWKNELADYQPGNSLSKQPLPIKEEGKTEFARKHLIIRPELYESIKRYSRENNLTQNTLIQAAWIIALSRHLERNDVVIGICMTGRSSGVGNIEEMMGPTLNILPMRVKLKPDEPFEAWLKNLMHKTVELSAYESISLNKICEWNRVADSRELFESYLVFQNIGSKEILQKTKSNFYFSKMGFPLRIDFFPQSQISLHMSYYRNVLSDDVIDQLMIDMVIILKMITEMSGVSLGKIVESIMDGRKMETGKIFTYYEDYLCIRQITESENECE
jgi:SAM-dependent methyltransferase